MKKSNSFLLLIIIFIINSCTKKDNVESNTIEEKKIENFILTSKDVKLNYKRDSLFSICDISQRKSIILSDERKLDYVKVANQSKDLYLIIYYYNNKIVCANYLEIKNREIDIDATLKTFYDQDISRFSGSIVVYDLFTRFKYEIGYTNGNNNFLKRFNPEPSNGMRGCTNYYLVTYWSDGTVDYEFLFQSCENCEQTRLLSNTQQPDYRCGAGGNKSGGGNSSSGDSPIGETLKELCGGYNWLRNGTNGYTSEILGLALTFIEDDGRKHVKIYFAPCCVTLPVNGSQSYQASDKFNDAWNKSVRQVREELENSQLQPYENPIKTRFNTLLTSNLGPGSTIQYSPCSNNAGNIPQSTAKYCNRF